MPLKITDLSVSAGKKPILNGINMTIKPGEIHVVMGPNGSGKSTLASTLLGHPKYTVTKGKITVDGRDLTGRPPDERAKAGLFLSAQQAPEIHGVTVSHFLRVASAAVRGKTENPFSFYESLKKTMKKLDIDPSFASRYLNAGFSGGEKKRAEILQLLTLDPAYAILDETDAGLDVDALKIVGKGLAKFAGAGKGLLVITHQTRLLKYLKPDFVHIIVKGSIVRSGKGTLAAETERSGYNQYL